MGIVGVARMGPASVQTTAAFWTSMAATTVLLLTVRFGTVAAAGFIGIWGLYFLTWPKLSADAMLRTVVPWAFPLFAIVSALWSTAPDLTIRNGLEWLITTGIAVVMATSLPMDRLLASWVFALVPVVVVGGLLGGSQFTETGEVAAVGIFASKNNFALHISLMFFVSLAVLANSRQPRMARMVALFGFAVGPVLLWKARSVGALAVFLPSLIMMCTVIGIGRMTSGMRHIAFAGCVFFILVFSVTILPLAMQSKEELLHSVGKSGDLTGRGLLWRRADVLIDRRPILGVGYSAFWVQGNPEAEALWRAEHIPARAGFHFHNFYYEALVELGYLGLAIGLSVFGLAAAVTFANGLRRPGPETGFFCAMMLFLFMRSFVELDLIGGFGLTAVILPVAWIYGTRRNAANPRWAIRLPMPNPNVIQPRVP